jgi:hypothetical protein
MFLPGGTKIGPPPTRRDRGPIRGLDAGTQRLAPAPATLGYLEHGFYCRRVGWRRRWWVHVWTGGLGVGSLAADREGVRQVHLDDVAALRDLITQLRADPTVRRWRYVPYDELDKTGAPTHCRCGRELDGLRSYAAEYHWQPCADCPGHDVYRCRGCGQVTVWPVPGLACQPSTVDRRRRPPPYPDSGGPRTT